MYTAQKGKGAFLNGKRIHVSKRTKVAETLVIADLTTKRKFHTSFFTMLKKISKPVLGIRITNSTAINLAHVAAGRFDIYVKNHINLLDAAPGICLIREAGGVVTDLHGNPPGAHLPHIIAGNKSLQKKILRLL